MVPVLPPSLPPSLLSSLPPSSPPRSPDDDETLSDEMEGDEFNQRHPATAAHVPTPGVLKNKEEVDEHVAYLRRALSTKEGSSSEVRREGGMEEGGGGRQGNQTDGC